MTILKYIIGIVFICLISSETTFYSGEQISFREEQLLAEEDSCGFFSGLSKKVNALVDYISSDPQACISGYDGSGRPFSVRQNSPFNPFYIDLLVRTTDWFSSFCKVSLNRISDFILPGDTHPGVTISCQTHTTDSYILPLKYYIYALKKIIT